MKAAPQFKHDCDACTFLGTYVADYSPRRVDLYFCTAQLGATVIARYGDVGSEYKSGLGVAAYDPDLMEAKRRAVALGLLT